MEIANRIRRLRDTMPSTTTGERTELRMPWWVNVFTNAGRPIVAILVMVMCAPGEHHLAVLAGWNYWLAWGMPGCLVAYAGIAAVVATKRPRGSYGKKSANVGAVVALLLAMAAQPVSHLFVTKHWASVPPPVALVIAVSCIPPLVLGHLLHLAATPVHVPDAGTVRGTEQDATAGDTEVAPVPETSAVPAPKVPKMPRTRVPVSGTGTETERYLDGVARYQASVDAGSPMSQRELASAMGMTGRKLAAKIIADVEGGNHSGTHGSVPETTGTTDA